MHGFAALSPELTLQSPSSTLSMECDTMKETFGHFTLQWNSFNPEELPQRLSSKCHYSSSSRNITLSPPTLFINSSGRTNPPSTFYISSGDTEEKRRANALSFQPRTPRRLECHMTEIRKRRLSHHRCGRNCDPGPADAGVEYVCME